MATATRELTLKQACKRLGITRSTFIRWATVGVDGKRLSAFKRGGRWFTTEGAIDGFKTFPGEAGETAFASSQTQSAVRRELRERFGI